ncbi:MAG: carboxylesterase family protein [Candidatus Binatus sp.]
MFAHCKEGKLSRLAVRSIIVAFALALAGAFSAAPALAHNPAIVTRNGPMKGTSIFGVEGYLGIPYAVPPVGDLRWKPPVPSGRFPGGVFHANQFGNFCTQPSGVGAEDCLTLNVFTPNIKKNSDNKKPVPVMVWIHGGGLVDDGSFDFDPSPLVLAGNVIVVTINYRLGFLGFFAQSALDAEGHTNGNYGFMDQQLALKWVNDNIAAFGGDTSRITIFGESAGGQSVYANLASPTAAGLFEGAIAESGAYAEFQDYFDFIVSLSDGETVGVPGSTPSGDSVATALGCPGPPAETLAETAACLRALPAAIVINNEPATIYPFVDGTILTQTPGSAFASGEFNQVPIISGGNHDEWRIFVANQYDFTGHPLVTTADYDKAVLALWGTPLNLFVEGLYPLGNYGGSPGIALGASGTDGIFACPERNSVQSLSRFVTTYAYEFNDPSPPALLHPVATFPLGAYHGAEIQYLFDIDERFAGFNPFTAEQQSLSAAMVGYWTQFAATGNPNSAGEPAWPTYTSGTDEFQSLVPPTPVTEEPGEFAADHFCSLLWNAF